MHVLYYAGLLAAPGNPHTLNVIGPIPQPVLLRWDAPFSLDITNVDPDISNYMVFVTNLNTSQNGSETVAGTETEYVFTNLSGEGQNPCHVYAFTIAGMNLAGEGNSSETVLGSIRGGLYRFYIRYLVADDNVMGCNFPLIISILSRRYVLGDKIDFGVG